MPRLLAESRLKAAPIPNQAEASLLRGDQPIPNEFEPAFLTELSLYPSAIAVATADP